VECEGEAMRNEEGKSVSVTANVTCWIYFWSFQQDRCYKRVANQFSCDTGSVGIGRHL
jgi:hypothetical protein